MIFSSALFRGQYQVLIFVPGREKKHFWPRMNADERGSVG
jgi:hypothetical protein